MSVKFPHNRATVYCVVRMAGDNFTTITGVFSDLADAEAYQGACRQEWKDKVGDGGADEIDFEVTVSTFYG